MNVKSSLTGALVALALAAAPAHAADRFKVDPAHTNFVFLVSHIGYSTMIGQFNEFDGEFSFDDDDPTNSSVSVVIRTGSVDTDHQARDDHLRSPDFFNAAEFPEMTFDSTSVKKNGDGSLAVTGDLTLLGITKPVTLDVTVNKIAPWPFGERKGLLTGGFSARGTLKRSEFGMTYGLGGIGDEVELMIEVEGQKI